MPNRTRQPFREVKTPAGPILDGVETGLDCGET